MLIQTFGELLFTPPSSEVLKEFPSPESLKRRIIVSTKPPKEYLQAKTSKENESNSSQKEEKDVVDDGAWGKELSSLKYGAAADYKVCDTSVSMLTLVTG